MQRGQKRRRHVENRARRKPARDRAKKTMEKIRRKNRQRELPTIDIMSLATRHLSTVTHRPWRDMFGTRG